MSSGIGRSSEGVRIAASQERSMHMDFSGGTRKPAHMEWFAGGAFFCSNRGRKPGCGRTFSILLRCFLPHFVVTATTLMQLVLRVPSGVSLVRAWLEVARTRFTVRTGFRLWKRLREAQPHIRTAVTRRGPPPECAANEPLAQMVMHLREQVEDDDSELFAAFQEEFQVRLLR